MKERAKQGILNWAMAISGGLILILGVCDLWRLFTS